MEMVDTADINARGNGQRCGVPVSFKGRDPKTKGRRNDSRRFFAYLHWAALFICRMRVDVSVEKAEPLKEFRRKVKIVFAIVEIEFK